MYAYRVSALLAVRRHYVAGASQEGPPGALCLRPRVSGEEEKEALGLPDRDASGDYARAYAVHGHDGLQLRRRGLPGLEPPVPLVLPGRPDRGPRRTGRPSGARTPGPGRSGACAGRGLPRSPAGGTGPRPSGPPVSLGARASDYRRDRASPEAARAILSRVSRADGRLRLSATQVSELLSCPFAWLLARGLALEEEVSGVGFFDALLAGEMGHETLRVLYGRIAASGPLRRGPGPGATSPGSGLPWTRSSPPLEIPARPLPPAHVRGLHAQAGATGSSRLLSGGGGGPSRAGRWRAWKAILEKDYPDLAGRPRRAAWTAWPAGTGSTRSSTTRNARSRARATCSPDEDGIPGGPSDGRLRPAVRSRRPARCPGPGTGPWRTPRPWTSWAPAPGPGRSTARPWRSSRNTSGSRRGGSGRGTSAPRPEDRDCGTCGWALGLPHRVRHGATMSGNHLYGMLDPDQRKAVELQENGAVSAGAGKRQDHGPGGPVPGPRPAGKRRRPVHPGPYLHPQGRRPDVRPHPPGPPGLRGTPGPGAGGPVLGSPDLHPGFLLLPGAPAGGPGVRLSPGLPGGRRGVRPHFRSPGPVLPAGAPGGSGTPGDLRPAGLRNGLEGALRGRRRPALDALRGPGHPRHAPAPGGCGGADDPGTGGDHPGSGPGRRGGGRRAPEPLRQGRSRPGRLRDPAARTSRTLHPT
ncbi:MAG: hypothetical protein MZV64_09545 [Ignavibacteriales bacterium]|nr:hypothetical protein [Ignavibacteriales bacterium]